MEPNILKNPLRPFNFEYSTTVVIPNYLSLILISHLVKISRETRENLSKKRRIKVGFDLKKEFEFFIK